MAEEAAVTCAGNMLVKLKEHNGHRSVLAPPVLNVQLPQRCYGVRSMTPPPHLQPAASFHSVCLISDWFSLIAPTCGFRRKKYTARLSEASAFDRVDAA